MTSGTWLAAAAVVVGAAVLALVWRLKVVLEARGETDSLRLMQQQLDALRSQLQQALASQGQLVGQQLAQLTAQMNERLREGGEVVQRSQAVPGERLDHAAQVVGEVQRGLGELRTATAKVYEVGRDVATLSCPGPPIVVAVHSGLSSIPFP